MIWMDPFIPSPRAAWLGPALLALAALLSLGSDVCALGWPPSLVSADDRSLALGWTPLVLVLFYFGHGALRFFVPPLLHLFAASQPAVQVETARLHESGPRGCRSMAELPGNGLLLRRRQCALPHKVEAGLRESGRIELRGQRSYFGISVADYAAAPAR